MQQDHLPRNQARSLIKEVREGDLLLALILPDRFSEPGIHFVTPGEFSQQLAYMRHPAGKIIEPHIHNKEANLTIIPLPPNSCELNPEGNVVAIFARLEPASSNFTTISSITARHRISSSSNPRSMSIRLRQLVHGF